MTQSVDEILVQLSYVRDRFPDDALRGAIACGTEVVDPLIAAIEDATREPTDLPGDYVLHFCAMHVLAQRRERRAYHPIVQMCRLSEQELDAVIGSVVTGSLPKILASVAQEDISPLQELFEDDSVNEWVRSSVLRAITTCAVEGAISQELFVDYFAQLWQGDRIARRACVAWDEMACVTAEFGLSEFLGDIEVAFDEGLIVENMITREEVVSKLTGDQPRFQPRRPEQYSFLHDAAVELKWLWPRQDEAIQEHQPRVDQSYRAPAKVGRNELCPCGSGRKHKKCCGKPS